MLSGYFRTAVRALYRYRTSALINLIGMAVALACCITVYLFLGVYYSLDTFHDNADRIAFAETIERQGAGGTERIWGTAPLPLGPALAADLASVEHAARVVWDVSDVRTSERAFTQRVAFADPDLFDVFTFPLQAGDSTAWHDPSGALVSAETAQRFFGTEDVLGEPLTVTLSTGEALITTVTGVLAPLPNNASVRFEVLLPIAAYPADLADWNAEARTFLLLRDAADLESVSAHAQTYVGRAQAGRESVAAFAFEHLTDPAPWAAQVMRRPAEAPSLAMAGVLVGLAALMLALASINYVNIALGSGAQRLKEIAVRKAIGASRASVVAQFMTEHLVLCALALVAGVGVAYLGLVPLFNSTFVLKVELTLLRDWQLWAFLVILLGTVALVSGAYPALYVASFEPTEIMRGRRMLTEPRWLTRGLLTAQFTIACLAALATALLLANGRFLAHQPWGYDPGETFIVRLSDPAQYERLQAAAAGHASVRHAVGAQLHVGYDRTTAPVTSGLSDTHHATHFAIGPGYTEAMGLRIVQGRSFESHDAGGDALLITERFAAARGWTNPIGERLTVSGQDRVVVGVVGDVLETPIAAPRGTVLTPTAEGYRYLVVTPHPGAASDARAALEAAWIDLAPHQAFDAFNQTDVFDPFLSSFASLTRSIALLAALALGIACMGLFGLATQNAVRRRREVGVRKALGASAGHIVYAVNRSYLLMLSLAAILSTTAGLVGVGLLSGIEELNMMPLSPLPFGLAYTAVAATVALALAAQSRSLTRTNPAQVLRQA